MRWYFMLYMHLDSHSNFVAFLEGQESVMGKKLYKHVQM